MTPGKFVSTAAPEPHVLREYALLADGERGAIVGPRGDVAWLCVPGWDSPSVFGSLLGGSGHYTLVPSEPHVWGGYYEDGSLIWRSRWVTRSGIVESRDALVLPADPHRVVLLRQVHAVDGAAELDVVLRPRGDYDHRRLTEVRRDRGHWVASAGPIRLRWSGGGGARLVAEGAALALRLRLPPGARHDFVLELSDRPLPDQIPEAERLWTETEKGWHRAVPAVEGVLAPADVRHSHAVLRGLTTASGGMVAAATTSLPERAEAGRNYDYRYVWIRDLCYAGQALAALGPDPMLRQAVDVVGARLLEHGDRMAPAYRVSGAPIPRERHIRLPGYPGGSDVAGNRVADQFQLDPFGEALLLFEAAGRHDMLTTTDLKAVEVAVAAIRRRWNEPDAGIWEIEPKRWTHSRLTAVAGLRAAVRIAPRSRGAEDVLALAARIVAEMNASALHPDGYWQRAPGDPGLDAALLLPALRGAVPPDDPRSRVTLRAYLRDLTQDGYAYRYRHDQRPLEAAEGSFLLCGFLVAQSLAQQGNPVEARAWFERTSAACGPPALFSEEYDVRQHQMRGNLAQGFVHALMVESAVKLGRSA